jgi:NitT/TauT family transport system ATP-binding protein
VFQSFNLFPHLTVLENLTLAPIWVKQMPKAEAEDIAMTYLKRVRIPEQAHKYPGQLSGGQQQRVAIARAIAYRPEVLLMDEPFAAVDAQTRADLEDLVRGVWKRLGLTVLFVTHDIDESVYLGERVIILSSSPTVVQEVVPIGLPTARDQLETRSSSEFAELRHHVYEQIQRAKRGFNADTVVAGADSASPSVPLTETDHGHQEIRSTHV